MSKILIFMVMVYLQWCLLLKEKQSNDAYLVIDDDDLQEANRLNDYLFNSPGAEGDYLLMMGHGMLYNHSQSGANASWEIDDDNRFVRFYATKAIEAGAEILMTMVKNIGKQEKMTLNGA